MMVVNDMSITSYVPLLRMRPAEMQALEELPVRSKNILTPFIQLGPWATADKLESSLTRLGDAYDDRPCFVTLCEEEPTSSPRTVHGELARLRSAENGYSEWCSFVQSRRNFIPALQLRGDPASTARQISRLHSLGRGMMVALPKIGFGSLMPLAGLVGLHADKGRDVCFLLDYGAGNRDLLFLAGDIAGQVETIQRLAPLARVAISASSFPSSFGAIIDQPIFERQLFNLVTTHSGLNLIYSDRGSARTESHSGGGVPYPRVDYSCQDDWQFFRADTPPETQAEKIDSYISQARRTTASSAWDSSLRIWGTQMIERTASGDQFAITSPMRATAVRINLHLQRQTFYGRESDLHETDDEWTD